jgi:hypothetical protein
MILAAMGTQADVLINFEELAKAQHSCPETAEASSSSCLWVEHLHRGPSLVSRGAPQPLLLHCHRKVIFEALPSIPKPGIIASEQLI